MLILVLFMVQVTLTVTQEFFDFQLHHNLTAERILGERGDRKSLVVNKYATQGFGRILSWNIKKLGACLRQDNVQQLKDTVCSVLQSANVIALQEAENLDLSCLPCNAILKDDYEWPGAGSSEEFKVLIKTRHQRSFSIKKMGKCSTANENGAKRHLDEKDNKLYREVMRAFKVEAQENAMKKSAVDLTSKVKNTNSTVENKTSDTVQNNNMTTSDNSTVNSRFTVASNQTNSTSDIQVAPQNRTNGEALKRFQLKNESVEAPTDNAVTLTRFLIQSERNNATTHHDNFTANAQNLTDRQVERFLSVNTEAEEIKEPNENDAKRELKERLYRSRERLNGLNGTHLDESKPERFKMIDSQLSTIEKEISEIEESNNSNATVVSKNITLPYSGLKNISTNQTLLKPSDSFLSEFLNNYSSSGEAPSFNRSNTNTSVTKLTHNTTDTKEIKTMLNVLKGSRKSIVEDFHEKTILSLPSRHKVVLLKNVFRNSGHELLKRTLRWSRDKRRSLLALKRRRGLLAKRDAPIDDNLAVEDVHYTIMVVTSDLNSGDPFLLVNLRLPKEKTYQRRCVGDIIVDISRVLSEEEKKMKVLIMGDFHFDRLTGYDNNGWLYKLLNNLHINDENYHSAITYNEKDPITTVYGRRFDNIITNINVQGNMKIIGPDFPLVPDAVILPFTLQRLYNNYMTAFYTTDSDDADSIYECIKAYQIAGKKELDNNVCKDTWVPSSYISDHLPLQITARFKIPQRVAPVELNMASWNIQGSSFKERLLDSAVKKAFVKTLKTYHVAIFHEFPTHDKILEDEEIGASDIVRLTQGELTTEFGIFINQYAKDGETDMFALRKKFHSPNENEDKKRENIDIISTVGLFIPKLVIDTMKIRPCLYTVKTSEAEAPSTEDFSSILDAIHKDVQQRDCDFKMLLASLNLDEKFNLEKEIYKKYKFINMRCTLPTKENKYSYNIPRSRDLADYIILIGGKEDVTFTDCTIGLPGDERKRGIEKLNDFEELTTHYPLSLVVKKSDLA